MSVTQLQSNVSGVRAPLRHDDQTVGPWRLVRLLGQGRWSVVYQAMPANARPRSQANYVVKLLKDEYQHDRFAISQLNQEARVGNSVAHPNVQCVLSARLDRPPYYLVMPYQEGMSLREYLATTASVPIAGCLWFARQLAEALSAIHDHGMIHCDVKPENIHVASSGHLTLCDLGLAQCRERDSNSPETLAGTIAYLPPEAFCAEVQLTSARDVYALGVTLFEMLTRQKPFPQLEMAELAEAHRLIRPPDARSIRPDVPADVARLLKSLLAKEPLRRPTGRDLVSILVDLEIECFDQRCAA